MSEMLRNYLKKCREEWMPVDYLGNRPLSENWQTKWKVKTDSGLFLTTINLSVWGLTNGVMKTRIAATRRYRSGHCAARQGNVSIWQTCMAILRKKQCLRRHGMPSSSPKAPVIC